ncbi:hypothetical protein RhiirA1_502647 [Rhizophagus irregularis]|uniref:Uncharacterized protein n=1 Tax=Rhizophagus irregularis TaxID=588596 RepID=A0A2N0QXD8_9GLOM|nr:hypothetical protein RhiirA1_502647 [Rhizophagus irregularis]
MDRTKKSKSTPVSTQKCRKKINQETHKQKLIRAKNYTRQIRTLTEHDRRMFRQLHNIEYHHNTDLKSAESPSPNIPQDFDDSTESDHKQATKTKIEHYFPRRPSYNVNNNEELSGTTLVPDDISNIQEQYLQSDGCVTPSPCSQMSKNSTVELPRVEPKSAILVDIDNNPFFIEESDDILAIDDILCDLTFENEASTNDVFLEENNISLLFRNYQNQSLEIARNKGLFVETNVHEILSLSSILLLTTNSHSNGMISLFGSPLLDKIHQEFMPKQQIELDPKCESIIRKAIKMAMKESCEDATNWFYGQLINENNLRENAGCIISDCLRTLPMSNIRSDHSETTHITNYLDRIMRGFFDDPNRHIVEWPNTALEESRRKSEGRPKQPDFKVSVVHQLQRKAVLFVGEVSPPSQKDKVFKNCNDLICLGVFMKDCLDSAIDKGADVKVIGFQCVDYKIDFYIMDLVKGIYTMLHVGQMTFPASIKEMLSFVDEIDLLFRVRENFRESFNVLYTNLCHPSPPLTKASFKRDTLKSSKFRQLVHKTHNVNRPCPFWYGRF